MWNFFWGGENILPSDALLILWQSVQSTKNYTLLIFIYVHTHTHTHTHTLTHTHTFLARFDSHRHKGRFECLRGYILICIMVRVHFLCWQHIINVKQKEREIVRERDWVCLRNGGELLTFYFSDFESIASAEMCVFFMTVKTCRISWCKSFFGWVCDLVHSVQWQHAQANNQDVERSSIQCLCGKIFECITQSELTIEKIAFQFGFKLCRKKQSDRMH